MADFVLIHGGFRGAWCWSKLISELENLGHRGFALDLPGHGEDSTPRETVTKESYLRAANELIASIDSNDIVIVGHSLAGIILPDLSEVNKLLIKEVIYLAALVLEKGQMAIELIPEDRRLQYYAMAEKSSDRSLFFEFETVRNLFLNDFSEVEAKEIFSKLTPQPFEVYLAPTDVTGGAVGLPTRYIVCSQDAALPPQHCRAWAKQLNCPVEEIDSGHDVMLSQPVKLAKILVKGDTYQMR